MRSAFFVYKKPVLHIFIGKTGKISALFLLRENVHKLTDTRNGGRNSTAVEQL